MTHKQLMQRAIELAQEGVQYGEVPVGAVIACEGEIVAEACNERERTADPTAHAEVLAIRRAAQALKRRRLHDCTLYVTLEPCPMCAGSIVMAGLKAVYFGAYDLQKGCAGSIYSLCEDPAFGEPIPCIGGIEEEVCAGQLKEFFKKVRV